MDALTHSLDRTLVIQAAPETVFAFFTDSARWARWWGAGSTIDARPGGQMTIRYPTGVEVSGDVVEVEAPRRIV
ncbi:MAG TPA: SRPBCC domain-containing protein, partial [Bryobacteraceae bacterium]|nr:SRPBCC domain-containing protein [Bryobacteraceae bacterium]